MNKVLILLLLILGDSVYAESGNTVSKERIDTMLKNISGQNKSPIEVYRKNVGCWDLCLGGFVVVMLVAMLGFSVHESAKLYWRHHLKDTPLIIFNSSDLWYEINTHLWKKPEVRSFAWKDVAEAVCYITKSQYGKAFKTEWCFILEDSQKITINCNEFDLDKKDKDNFWKAIAIFLENLQGS